MRIYWAYPTFAPFASYAKLSNEFGRELTRRGHEFIPIAPYELKNTPGAALIRKYPGIGSYCPTVVTGTAGYMKGVKVGRVIGFTMFESTKIPDDWPKIFSENCESVIVPCQWCKDSFVESGYAGKIDIVPLGVDTREFKHIERKREDNVPFRFLSIGDHGLRKGWDVVMRALCIAFGPRDALYNDSLRKSADCIMDDFSLSYNDYYKGPGEVEVIIKCAETAYGVLLESDKISDRRVKLWRENVDTMYDVYSIVDCMVFPTRGEGYGLPPREAASTGLPVICTKYSGTDDVENWGLPLDYKEVAVPYWASPPNSYYRGSWAEPDVFDLAKKMRLIYENRNCYRSGYQWIHENCTWEIATDRLLEVLCE